MSLTADQWQRIVELNESLKITARYWARRVGGDYDDMFSVGRLAVIEEAQANPDILDQEDSYITTFASWRMRDHLDPRWPEENAIPLNDVLDTEPSTSFEGQWLALQSIVDKLNDEELEIIRTILEYGDDVLHGNGKLNVSALARETGNSQSTMSRRVASLRTRWGPVT